MSFMTKLFGAQPTPGPMPTPAQQAVTNNPATNPAPQEPHSSATTGNNGVVPPNANEPAPPPLDQYKDLWQPTPIDPNAPKPPEGVDPAKIMEAAAKVDFSKLLDQGTLAKVVAGGEGAVGALAEILNKQSQTVYGQSMAATARIVEEAVGRAEQKFADQLPSLIKRQNTNESLFSENPAFNNPALAPVIHAIQTQLVQKYPKATSSELTKMAKEIFQGAAQTFAPPTPAPQGKGKKEEDWSAYLGQS
jgi:hypothetical protein